MSSLLPEYLVFGRAHDIRGTGERCKFDSIGVGVTGALRPWLFHK